MLLDGLRWVPQSGLLHIFELTSPCGSSDTMVTRTSKIGLQENSVSTIKCVCVKKIKKKHPTITLKNYALHKSHYATGFS